MKYTDPEREQIIHMQHKYVFIVFIIAESTLFYFLEKTELPLSFLVITGIVFLLFLLYRYYKKYKDSIIKMMEEME